MGNDVCPRACAATSHQPPSTICAQWQCTNNNTAAASTMPKQPDQDRRRRGEALSITDQAGIEITQIIKQDKSQFRWYDASQRQPMRIMHYKCRFKFVCPAMIVVQKLQSMPTSGRPPPTGDLASGYWKSKIIPWSIQFIYGVVTLKEFHSFTDQLFIKIYIITIFPVFIASSNIGRILF